jgi:hypothetical protein
MTPGEAVPGWPALIVATVAAWVPDVCWMSPSGLARRAWPWPRCG